MLARNALALLETVEEGNAASEERSAEVGISDAFAGAIREYVRCVEGTASAFAIGSAALQATDLAESEHWESPLTELRNGVRFLKAEAALFDSAA